MESAQLKTMLVVCVTFSVLGGLTGAWLFSGSPVAAQDQSQRLEDMIFVLEKKVEGIQAKNERAFSSGEIICRSLRVQNEDGDDVVRLDAAQGRGLVRVYGDSSKSLIYAGSSAKGNGLLVVFNNDGKESVSVRSSKNGAWVSLFSRSGKEVVQLYSDQEGNGVVGAFDQAGAGKTMRPE